MNINSSSDISKKIFDIQKQWANYIIEIGKSYLKQQDYIILTKRFLDDLYCFKHGKVLFKPTKASHIQFRNKKKEFISYFIGHNKISNEDNGFALEPWKNISFENFDIIALDNIFLSMGNYFFTNYENKNLKVEYSFGYILDSKKKLKIIFHHSSIPYNS